MYLKFSSARQVVRDLKHDPPEAIIASGYELEQMEGRGDKMCVDYGDFPAWIREHYAPAPSPENSHVWIRKD